MAPQAETPAVEWRDDAKPLSLCILCDKELAPEEPRCPQCQSPASHVHRCPKCARVVSAKHLRCPYCSEGFLKSDPHQERQTRDSAVATVARRHLDNARELEQRRKVLWFSLAVFLTVFVLATALQRYREGAGGEATVLGTSFVLHDVPLRRSGSAQGAVVASLTPPAVVDITGVERDEQGQDWFQIRWGEGLAYVPVNSLAPPKAKQADGGYKLLRASLTNLTDAGELGDASSAVRLYRSRYPADARGEELLWILAEKTRELGLHKRDPRILAGARKAYDEVARAGGPHAAGASEALSRLAESPGAAASVAQGQDGAGRESPAASGAPEWRVYDPKSGANKIMLLSETEVSVTFSAQQAVKDGDILSGEVARAVVSNGETIIPAGSVCRVKVSGGSAGKGWVDLSLVEIQIGGKSYAVESTPVRIRVGQSLSHTHQRFRLQRSLLLAR